MDSYQDTLAFLYEQLPMYQRIGADAVKKDLSNIKRLCHLLGHPHRRFKSIHVAGTNGKGSVSHMVASILQACGHRVGLYTSPHYRDFRERIKINGQYISEEEVIDFVNRIRCHLTKIRPSFFEITVAMAFDHFCRHQVDCAVIETGLGGRLDSTNIVLPMMSIITNIDFDHQDMLGETLPEIALEKAGIMKPGIPVVIGRHHEDTDPVFVGQAKEVKAPLSFSDEWCTVSSGAEPQSLAVSMKDKADHLTVYVKIDVAGPYQVENAQTALAAIEILRQMGWSIAEQEWRAGLENIRDRTGFLGRWQILQREPLIIVDSAHNADGIAKVMSELSRMSFQRLRIVFGMVRNKDFHSIVTLLPQNADYYFCAADQPRSMPAHELCSIAEMHGLTGTTFSSVKTALDMAINEAHKDDLIFVGGSTFITAEVL